MILKPDKEKGGKIAQELDYVNHHMRLSDVNWERLRILVNKQYELSNQIDRDHLKIPQYLNHVNKHTFEIDDLIKLIKKTSEDLTEVERKRRADFKEYELQKKKRKREIALQEMNEEKRKEFQHKQKEFKKKKHKKHEKIHQSGNKAQLEEL
uniref:NUCB1-like N-terminal domain-containing protein n=1 Tax=Glossina brevipalpis TaxID=37001 RepID=A0A1A9WSG7_9MUSC